MRPLHQAALLAVLLASGVSLTACGESSKEAAPAADRAKPPAPPKIMTLTELRKTTGKAIGSATAVRTTVDSRVTAGTQARTSRVSAATLLKGTGAPATRGSGTVASGQPLDVIDNDGTLYMRQKGAESRMPAGKTWVAISKSDQSKLRKKAKGNAQEAQAVMAFSAKVEQMRRTFQQASPKTWIPVLLGEGSRFTAKPVRENTGGQATVKYSGTVSGAKLLARHFSTLLTSQQRKAISKNDWRKVAKRYGLEKLDWVLWSDARSFPSKAQSTAALRNGGKVTSTMTFADWNTAPDVKAPPAQQVAKLSEFLSN